MSSQAAPGVADPKPVTRLFLPKYRPALLDSLKHYKKADFLADLVAGLNVAIVALPLSIALAIAVGATPQAGLFTAIVGGAAIAIFGGSRVQVSGPTAAFIVVLSPICVQYGLEGLQVAGLMAGVILILMGVTGLGSLIKYVPYPVTMGFTMGIAVSIGVIQIKDFFGLRILREETVIRHVPMVVGGEQGDFVVSTVQIVETMPQQFHQKLTTLAHGFQATPWDSLTHAACIGLITLAILVFVPRYLEGLSRRVPAILLAVLVSVLCAQVSSHLLGWKDVATIGDRFPGGLPRGLPPFNSAMFMKFTWSLENLEALILPATAIAVLGAITSLLSAVVADGVSNTKHDSNSELIGQGVGNILSPLFGGIAVSGAIARTLTGIRLGARSPLASLLHSVALVVLLIAFAPYAVYIPMATLAAILLLVAWNMANFKHFRHLLQAPASDTLVLLTCLGLTVFTDMAIAVLVGMILAAMLFMRRMADVTSVHVLDSVSGDAELQSHDLEVSDIPAGVLIYSVDGPFFFGASEKAITAMEGIGSTAKIVVLRMNRVPAMDATGLFALEKILEHLKRRRVHLVLSGVRQQPRLTMQRAGFLDRIDSANVTPDIEWAIVRCYDILGPDARNKRTGKTQTIPAPQKA